MRTSVGNASFIAPPSFLWSESTVSFRAPPTKAVSDPRMLQKQAMVARPNIVVNQRTITDFQTLNEVADDVTKRLMATVKEIDDLQATAFQFEDGKAGILISYVFPYHKESLLRQMHAVRLDDKTVTTMVLTCGSAISDDEQADYVKALATVVID
ncbi:MAG: DUF1795 domain-containing protein [Deltaproteobacteria bacterium]|nr:DUF1795 domain-containing protein [Deltaproteobacteria bacterium]